MLQRILRKRTRVEKNAYQQIRELMPRGRKTRGLQYEVLEFLFNRLYERVPEEEVRNHLLEVKGHLQPTGDPVKGAINAAIKELQRLPDRPFEIIKIQQATLSGQRRYVQLNFERFEEVINFELYREYVQEVLANEEHIFLRAVSSGPYISASEMFPGLKLEDLGNCRGDFLVSPQHARADLPSHVHQRFLPRSAANMRLLLFYEDKEQPVPFLGFVASVGIATTQEEMGFILYRGSHKLNKLQFLDRLWDNLNQTALGWEELEQLQACARNAAAQIHDTQNDWYSIILDGLLAEAMTKVLA